MLIVSADDQNSIFKIFGADDKIFESDDNYLEFYIAGKAELGDLLIEVRDNLYLIKTLNTDKLSMKLTYERSQEKILKGMFKEYSEFFDYILIDFPPSSSRLTEILLEISDGVCIVQFLLISYKAYRYIRLIRSFHIKYVYVLVSFHLLHQELHVIQ